MTPKKDQPRDEKGIYQATHGGRKAINQLQRGEPLTGLAATAEQAAETMLINEGMPAIMRRNALRLQAVSDLFYGAVCKAADDGDLAAVTNYAQRYGWLSGCALRAWQALAAVERGKNSATVLDVLESMKKSGENDTD